MNININLALDNDPINDYDDEDIYIMTVADDVLDNKFSDDEEVKSLE